MDVLKSYRLNSLEEPTEGQLTALMEQVGEAARESSQHAQAELRRRMAELRNTMSKQSEISY